MWGRNKRIYNVKKGMKLTLFYSNTPCVVTGKRDAVATQNKPIQVVARGISFKVHPHLLAECRPEMDTTLKNKAA